MNAPLGRLPTDLAPIEEVFAALCEARALRHVNGRLSLHDAVDQLQAYAERSGLIDTIGQDAIQDEMARAFAMTDDLVPADEDRSIADIVRGLELADPRDRWRHTGELPPPPEVRNGPSQPGPAPTSRYRTPQSTVDAFWYVVRSSGEAELTRWLSEHPKDSPYLQKLWEARCLTAAA